MADVAPQRNLGVEALRMLSMFMICVLHVLGIGGILTGAEARTWQYMLAWLMEAAAMCSVNCYALISGYVGVESGFKWSRLLRLWLEVIFYELLISLYFQIQLPDMMSSRRWLAAVTPVLSNEYWYITAYAGMFLFIPLMNAALNTLSRRRMTQVIAAGFALLILLPMLKGLDAFGLLNGYCMVWLCVLYIAGGYIRKYVTLPRGGKWWLLPVFAVAAVLSWLSPMMGDGRFIEYSSPTEVIAALALTLFFINTDFKSKLVRRLIVAAAPAALGVYLIHANPLIFSAFLEGAFRGFASYSAPVMALMVILAALGIYAVCTLIDMVRIKLFSLLHIDRLAGRIDRLLSDKK